MIDSVSLSSKFSKIDYIDPFNSENFNISVTVEGNNFRALLDSSELIKFGMCNLVTNSCLDSSSMSHATTVGSSPLIILGEVWLNFVIKSDVFIFEANVIKDLIHDVVLARDFRQKCCSKLDFIEKVVEFSHPEDPLPFPNGFGDHLDAKVDVNCVSSVHSDYSFTIPAQSPVVVFGKLKV